MRGWILALALLWPSIAHGETSDIAITYDDLPALTLTEKQPYVNDFTRRLLAGLKRHHIPAIGFVNAGKIDEIERKGQIAVLRQWLAAGMELGNHTFSHESPETLGTKGYIADIAKGEPILKRLLAQHHQKLRYFRHPFLHTGYPDDAKEQINLWLADHHYRIAPVTMENSDWVFSEPYDDALAKGDVAAAAHIKAEYLAYTQAMIDWYLAAGRSLFGRSIAHVMLLHASRLNADTVDDLAAMLAHNQLHPVSLTAAMQDPAYQTPDAYVGKNGPDWLWRWAIVLGKTLPKAGFIEPPAEIKAYYDRVDR